MVTLPHAHNTSNYTYLRNSSFAFDTTRNSGSPASGNVLMVQ